jgi:hypothetical protein
VSDAGGTWDDSGTAGGSGLRAATFDSPPVFILDEESDNVAIAIHDLQPGTFFNAGRRSIRVQTVVPAGHKIALHDLDSGDWIFKLGQPIGEATTSRFERANMCTATTSVFVETAQVSSKVA